MIRHSLEEIRLVQHMRYELFPTKYINNVIKYLPANSCVSVTSSTKHGVEETQALTMQLLAQGHNVCPHFAARLITGTQQTKQLADWIRNNGIKNVFIVAGDAKDAKYYTDSFEFIDSFLSFNPEVQCVSFAIYPDGHPMMTEKDGIDYALGKEKLIFDHGVCSEAVSQMCFDGDKIIKYVKGLREKDFASPIYIGIPGIISYSKLLSFGATLGISDSLQFLSQNMSMMSSFLSPSLYDPSKLVRQLAEATISSNLPDNGAEWSDVKEKRRHELNIKGVHAFTFNSTESTAAWAAGYSDDSVISSPPAS